MARRATPRRLALAVAGSLVLHTFLIALQPRPATRRDTPPSQALRVTLQDAAPPKRLPDAPSAANPANATGLAGARARRRYAPAPAAAPRAAVDSPSASAPGPASAADAAPPGPAPNAAALIESARGIARAIGREPVPQEPGVVPRGSPVERAFMRHLARSSGSAEKVLSDGSRWVRFRNGTCMFIPRFPGPGQVNGLGEPIATTTNCPESVEF